MIIHLNIKVNGKVQGVGYRNFAQRMANELSIKGFCKNKSDGSVYIEIETNGTNAPDFKSLAKYIVSHREVSHFHEEICEMMFVHLTEAYQPSRLMVACLYTRRGGIDINPIRASHSMLIPEFFVNPEFRIAKTLRQ